MVKKNIKNTIRKHNLINADEHIVIGLSGGPDSVCLFSVLNELKEELGITLHAVHVNHGFRPGAADEDQQYVEQLCAEKGVECTSFTYDCSAIAREQGLSSEEAGRKVRYESFLKVAERLMQGCSGNDPQKIDGRDDQSNKAPVPAERIKIAVAQNADDQAETVLFRLLRGTGTDGLAGIAYRRKEQNIEVIRPLLDTWRTDIEAYCVEQGLNPRIDHTNLQPIYTRNKIRLELIPYLQENFNENIMEALGRLSRIASEDKDYLWKCAEEAYNRIRIAGSGQQDSKSSGEGTIILSHQGITKTPVILDQQSTAQAPVILNQKDLADLEPAVRHRVVMRALQDVGLKQDVTAAHLDAVDSILTAAGESKTVEFPNGYRASVRYGEVAFYRDITVSQNMDFVEACDMVCDKNADFSSKCHMEEQKLQKVSRDDGQRAMFDTVRHAQGAIKHQTAEFDADKIATIHGDAQPVLRTRREGDYIAIKDGRKKIQNLFVDMKVPKEYRDSVLMAAVGSEIIWIPQQPYKGIKKARYSYRYKLDMDTKNSLELEFDCEI